MRAAPLLLAASLLTACLPQPPLTEPAPLLRSEWTTAQTQAANEVLAGRYGVADKILLDFAVRFPSSPEAIETAYWRALYKLDPANRTASARDAGALFDAYLGAPVASAHRADATALRRVASVLERASEVGPAAAGAVTPAAAARPDERASNEEVQRLRDDLAKANAELERIRRRLAQPKP